MKLYKYPRTFHFPWSPGITNDDKVLDSTDIFNGQEVVASIKMDGENTTLYTDHLHARSLDSGSHPSRNWIKNFHAGIQNAIPEGWRLCGENLFAKHSIHYLELPSYFMLFSIWNENNICLSWEETVEYAEILNITTVPVFYKGIWNEAKIRKIEDELEQNNMEGYVVRLASEFPYRAFRKSIAKFVRKNHVTSTHNWMMQSITKNKLKD